jgi:hypothetical protein
VPVPAGAEGKILHIYDANAPAYIVEFMDKAGNTIGRNVFDIKHEDLEFKIATRTCPDPSETADLKRKR